MLNLKAR